MSDDTNRSIIPPEAFARMAADLEQPAQTVPELLDLARRVEAPNPAERGWFFSNYERPETQETP